MISTFRIALAGALLCASPLALAQAGTAPAASEAVTAQVTGLDGAALGSVTLRQTPAGVLVSTDLHGLPPGEHGFHFHEKGACAAADKFASAGAHFAAGGQMHGLMTAGGPHGGDMPNQVAGADGLLRVQVLNTGVSLSPGPHSLLDADGSALVIHAAADDYVSQPAGNAGGRIACAVIAAPGAKAGPGS